ncbi:MAG: class I SAM-dependent methyltransferase [bacterium]|nr:class I SAM-dependent methyltransferase [bacterium]
MKDNKTSWGGVAEWYDDLLETSPDSFQKNVLMPNLIRIVEPKAGMTILDVACGQGYFSRAFAANGAKVVGCDISAELIQKAKNYEIQKKIDARKGTETAQGRPSQKKAPLTSVDQNPAYEVAPADKLAFAKNASADVVMIVLAIQNIENLAGTFSEASRVLKPGGRMILVLNHPAFRIPQRSSWEWDMKAAPGGLNTSGNHYRRLDAYMSENQIKIDMTPGEKFVPKKKFTFSFHRPLQTYFKTMTKAGFSVTRLEEWISHKKSQSGPRQSEEDRMRKEIPMFICLEARK